MGTIVRIAVVALAVLAGLFFSGALFPEPEPPQIEEGWWGRGPKQPDTDTSIREFKVEISDDVLQDMYDRLDTARYGEDLIDARFHYGFSSTEMKKVVEYWKDDYSWWKHEKILNSFPQYKTTIEGIDVHFLHVKPVNGRTGRPLLIVHGWPGSIWEFYKIIPMLTDPESYGRKDEEAFEVIAPSIPGYGFSEAPHRMGFNSPHCAGLFLKLMKRLGHEKFFTQGGDWGSIITTNIAQLYPQHLIGVHINMVSPPMGDPHLIVHQMAAALMPNLVLGEEHSRHFQPFTQMIWHLLEETGYFHIQVTKPDTIGMALNNSPIGLAAYIMEKFSTWTNKTYIDLPDGGLTKKFTLDELLTNVMIYWFSGNIASSQRFYKENLAIANLDRVSVKVPTGAAVFPEEIAVVVKPFAEYKFKDIVQYSYMETGGHFAAFEEPELLADDLFNFVHKLEQRDGVTFIKKAKPDEKSSSKDTDGKGSIKQDNIPTQTSTKKEETVQKVKNERSQTKQQAKNPKSKQTQEDVKNIKKKVEAKSAKQKVPNKEPGQKEKNNKVNKPKTSNDNKKVQTENEQKSSPNQHKP